MKLNACHFTLYQRRFTTEVKGDFYISSFFTLNALVQILLPLTDNYLSVVAYENMRKRQFSSNLQIINKITAFYHALRYTII